MRRAACRRTSLMLRMWPGAASGTVRGAGPLSGIGDEQAVISNSDARAPRVHIDSMQGTVDLLGQFLRHAVDSGQVLNAGAGHAADTAEALQQLGTLFW